MLGALLLSATPAFAVWQVDIESKSVDPNQTGVTVNLTVYWDLNLTALTVPVIVRSMSGDAFWTLPLPVDTSGAPMVGVEWNWSNPGWAHPIEEVRPGLGCDPAGDVGYDAVSPDHVCVNVATFGPTGTPAEPNGRVVLILTINVNSNIGDFEFDTACFTPYLRTIFIIDGVNFQNHGPTGIGDFNGFNKGVITIVGPENQCPTTIGAYVTDPVSGNENDALSNTHNGNYADPEGDNARFYLNSGPGAVDELTGAWNWTPACGDGGNYTVKVEVADAEHTGGGGCPGNIISFTVNVAAIPVGIDCSADLTVHWGDDALKAITASTTCTPVAFTQLIGPGATTLGGSYSWTTTCQDLGQHTVKVQATDNAARSQSCTFDVTVENELPSGTVPDVSFPYNEGYTIDLSTYITDPDGVSFSNLTINPTPNVMPTLTGNTVEWSPDISDGGDYDLTVDAFDGCQTETFDWDLTVYGPPVIECPGDTTAIVGEELTFDVTATDPNIGDIVEIRVVEEDLPGDASFDPITFTFAWIPTCSDVGVYTVGFIASDGELEDTCYVQITVVHFKPDQTSLTFDYQIGQPAPDAVLVEVTSTGCGEVDIDASVTPPDAEEWLTVEPPSGRTPKTLTISIDVTDLSSGTYDGNVVFTESPGAHPTLNGNVQILIPVTLNVTAGYDSCWVAQNVSDTVGATVAVVITFENGAALAAVGIPLKWHPDAVTLESVDFNGSRVEYLVHKHAEVDNDANTVYLAVWRDVEELIAPGKGLFATLNFHLDECCEDTIVIDTAFIAPNGYYEFVDPQAQVVPTGFVPGSIIVEPGELRVFLTPEQFYFQATAGGENPDCQTLILETDFCGVGVWGVKETCDWLILPRESGPLPDTAEVCVDVTGLGPGTYQDTFLVILAIPGLSASSKLGIPTYAVPVTLNVICDCGVWGDVTDEGAVNPQDVTYMVQYVYFQNDMRTQPPNCPYEAGDTNCDGQVNPQDVTFYVQYVYYTNNMFCPDPCGP